MGFKDTAKVWGLLHTVELTSEGFRLWVFKWKNLSASPGDMRRKPKPNEKMPSDSFQIQTPQVLHSLFFGKMDDRERRSRRCN